MRLSVVVVSWCSRDDTAACLASLRAQTHGDLEVIVVDNGSDDGSAELVRARFPEVVLLALGENLGFAEGCNRGIARATGAWVALLNSDATAEPQWAAELVRAAEALPAHAGMLQSLMLLADEPGLVNSTGVALTKDGRGRDRHERRPARDEGTERREIFCPTGGAAAYRRTMLDTLALPTGWLDREHFCYYEDVDLGWRARLAGFTAWLVPSSVVRHRVHGSTGRMGKNWLRVMTRQNRVRTLLKNASGGFLVRTLPRTLYDCAEVLQRGGLGGLRGLGAAARSAWRQRAAVGRVARVDRRAVEREWAGADDTDDVRGRAGT